MGLDIEELVMACEEEFDVYLPLETASATDIRTVGGFHAFILRTLGERKSYRCPTVAVFFSLRHALAMQLGLKKTGDGARRPATPVLPLSCVARD